MIKKAYKLGYQLAWENATKIADDTTADKLLGLGVGGLATTGLGLGSMGATMGGMALEHRLTPERLRGHDTVEKLRKAIRLPKTTAVNVRDYLEPLESHYIPAGTIPGSDASINVARKTPLSVLSHEMGHGSGKLRVTGKTAPLFGATKMLGVNALIPSLITQAIAEPGGTVSNVARYAPAALMAPSFLEEMRASLRGMRALGRVGGKGAVAKGLLSLLPALATYAIPAVSPIVGGKIIEHFRD